MKELERQDTDNWYLNYVRFLAALKNRVTKWKNRCKYRPSLPPYIIDMLKEVRQVRNKYYRERKANRGIDDEETRIQLRTMTRYVRHEVNKYKSERWKSFLSSIQDSHDVKGNTFWSHLSRIYKPKTLPLSKINTGSKTISDHQDITTTLYNYYKEQAKAPLIDDNDAHDQKIKNEYTQLTDNISKLIPDKQNPILLPEIVKFIKSLKNKKSSGYDQISNYMIKLLPPGYLHCLLKCFNDWLQECRYPDFWKIAKIVTLNKLKAGVPRTDQTRPISLLATHSKLFEKVILERVRFWAEGAQLVPAEQSGFRPRGMLTTRVLSIYQEIKNNLAANMPTLALYVDYRKAYDMVWHGGLLVKLKELEMPVELLKIISSWLKDRQGYIVFGEKKSDKFQIDVGLPQGSSLSPYLFIVYHCDLVHCLGAHSGHLFADDLCVLIRAPITKALSPIIEYLEKEGTKVCSRIAEYAKKWKQPINVVKTVGQIFHTQIERPKLSIYMEGQTLDIVNAFKYLGFTWTSKMSLKPTIDQCLEKVGKALVKLKWLKSGRRIATPVLRKCFFAYVFAHFAWIFPLYPFLPKTQREALDRKFRVAIRAVHRCPYVSAKDLFSVTQEEPLEVYVQRYIKKRLENIYKSDLGRSAFLEDLFYWDVFRKNKKDALGHYFRQNRVKKLIKRHETLLIRWIQFVQQ
jgi:hypothetical protein